MYHNITAEALERVDQSLPQIFKALIKKAMEGDREAQIYLIDRRLGCPHQSIDQRTKMEVEFTADDYLLSSRLRNQVKMEEQKLIEQYSPDLLPEKAGN